MILSELTAVGPLDGRYRKKIEGLASYFSEYALIKYRLKVEVEYLIALTQISPSISPLQALPQSDVEKLRRCVDDFGVEEAAEVKEFEKSTNHDVKAVEYFLKKFLSETDFDSPISQNSEFVHFGLTSQDINNTAIPLMLKDAMKDEILPFLQEVLNILQAYAEEWLHIPMLARTHGQAASPTTLGKEFAVFHARLKQQFEELQSLPIPGKFGGATGNMNAHYIAYPDMDWHGFARHFVEEKLGLSRSYPTTQIDHYDGLGRIFDCFKRINSTLMDLCQDVWIYVSMDYFKQKVKAGEVGSSAMPHKVNPIDFENAEGNCGLSTSLLEFLSRKLPISRLQRDLTDSTILRNVGVALGYHLLALNSLKKGLNKLLVNVPAISADLNDNWAVLAEAIQTILRREQYPKPYEALRDLTRGKSRVDAEILHKFIDGLEVSDRVKHELKSLTPSMYIGRP